MNKTIHLTALVTMLFCFTNEVKCEKVVWGNWPAWGDMNDGTYRNPILPADFSDIDCIEHDGWYYAISSTFQFSPGMVILKSSDMVNWRIISHAVPDVSQIGPNMNWDRMNRYACGIWAGSIRWHDGLFYVYFGTPDEGMFMTTAPCAEGPWAPLHKMNFFEAGWDDCCPLFDDDGKKYFVASNFANNYKTYIFRMTDDGRDIVPETATLVNEGMSREANKLYKINGTYYHLFSEYDGKGRYLMMQRAKAPMGPYTEKHQLSHIQVEYNEPNQGGYLQDAEGKWYYFTHHGHGDWTGRIASLLPVTWIDGWPIIGQPDKDDIGNMVWQLPKPVTAKAKKEKRQGGNVYQDLRDFTDPSWEWNYQPREGWYSIQRKSLHLKAFQPIEMGNLLKAGNTIVQRVWRSTDNEVTVRMDCRQMADGQRSGLCHFAEDWMEMGVRQENGQRQLYFRTRKHGDNADVIYSGPIDHIYLRSQWGLDGLCTQSYSIDGRKFTEIPQHYQMSWGNYRGDRVGLYTYNDSADQGSTTFNRFRYRVTRQNAGKK